MNWSAYIAPAALVDIEAAAEWYEEREPGLGADFVRTVRHAIIGLATNPLIHRLRDRRRNVRWFLLPRFPCRICYRVDQNRITVFAFIHGDGSVLDAEAVAEAIRIADELTLTAPWQVGDFVIVDNRMSMPARQPLTGKRKVVASLAEMQTQSFDLAATR